jgi:hypothetical protein
MVPLSFKKLRVFAQIPNMFTVAATIGSIVIISSYRRP